MVKTQTESTVTSQNFKETELMLSLPGKSWVGTEMVLKNSKCGLSETIDLNLGCSSTDLASGQS